MSLTKKQHLDRSVSPKRLLALDGGGIRGILSLQYLDRIESLLRERTGDRELVLSEYFDLIGGTSTGAIIAAALACGKSVAEVKDLYRSLGGSVFERKFWRRGLFVPKFPVDGLREALDTHLGASTTLNDEKIRTGLMIMLKRLDTGSLWPVHNHPESSYAGQDGKLLLTQVVRASTAAPTYFEPELIDINSRDGRVVSGAFVDGGVSPFNDPALQLLMVSVLHGYGFRFPAGSDNLFVLSIGTGSFKRTHTASQLSTMVAAEQGVRALATLMDDCGRVNRGMLQWLTECLTPSMVDRAVGDMQVDSRAGPKLAVYVRYNVIFDQDWLREELGIEKSANDVSALAAMDDPGCMDDLAMLGEIASVKQVLGEHFPARFDIS